MEAEENYNYWSHHIHLPTETEPRKHIKKKKSWIWKYFYSVGAYSLILYLYKKSVLGSVSAEIKSLPNLGTNYVLSENFCYPREARG